MFYRNENALVEQHLKLQRQPMLPPGVGGKGERLFLENFQNFGGYLTIYHGITSFLRMGDFSFFDPINDRIAATGELKTVSGEKGGHYLRMNLLTQFDSSFYQMLAAREKKSLTSDERLTKKQAERLAQQTARLLSSVKNADAIKDGPSLSASKRIDFTKLQSTLELSARKRFHYEVMGKGLLLFATTVNGSIFEREVGRRSRINWTTRLKGIEKGALRIINAGASDNSIAVSNIGFSDQHQPIVLSGMPPIAWWPLENQQKRELIFGRTVVASLYNSSYFFEYLTKRGYKLSIDDRGKLRRATKELPNGKELVLENLSYFQTLSEFYLFSQEVLECMIETMEMQWEEKQDNVAQIQLRPILQM